MLLEPLDLLGGREEDGLSDEDLLGGRDEDGLSEEDGLSDDEDLPEPLGGREDEEERFGLSDPDRLGVLPESLTI